MDIALVRLAWSEVEVVVDKMMLSMRGRYTVSWMSRFSTGHPRCRGLREAKQASVEKVRSTLC